MPLLRSGPPGSPIPKTTDPDWGGRRCKVASGTVSPLNDKKEFWIEAGFAELMRSLSRPLFTTPDITALTEARVLASPRAADRRIDRCRHFNATVGPRSVFATTVAAGR
jgi:hypothetical protein